MEAQELVDELTYRNYMYNRGLAPEITPEQWEDVYGETAAMEERYQKEETR